MKRFVKLLLLVIFILPFGVLLTGCNDEYTLVKGVDFNKEEIYLTIGQTVDLSYKVYPSNANNKTVNFSSSNESIAYIDEAGKITLRGNGEAVITIRTVDGGFIDTCKVVALVDPVSIAFKNIGNTIKTQYKSNGTEVDYYYTYISVNEVKKLPVVFLDQNGEESVNITNKNVVYTSSSPKNVSVINSAGGVIKGVSNQVFNSQELLPYSTITASLTSTNTGENISASIRVYVTENASANNLYVSTYLGGSVSNQSTVYLSSSNTDGELFIAFLLDYASFNSDFDIFFESSNSNIFSVKTDVENELPNPPVENVCYFKIIPGNVEGEAILYITISSSDEQGYQIRTYINVSVEGDVLDAKASTDVKTSVDIEELGNMINYQTMSVESVFSINLKYYGKDKIELENIERRVVYGIKKTDSQYISSFGQKIDSDIMYDYYSVNKFKVNDLKSEKIDILVRVSKSRSEINTETVDTYYSFFIKAQLDGVLITETSNPNDMVGLTAINASNLAIFEKKGVTREATLYVKTFSKLGRGGDPVSVSYKIEGSKVSGNDILEVELDQVTGICKIIVKDIGVSRITFFATDGFETVEYTLNVYVTELNN